MTRHHTKEKGDLGVLKAQVDLHQKGYQILTPLSEHSPFDLVVYKNSDFKRVQVKYKSVGKNGALQLYFRTCWADKHGTHRRPIDKFEVDVFCVYCPDTDECYYFDPKRFSRSIALRVKAPKNNQRVGINSLADFRRVP
ncbi:MAG: group I intron-associated PD-(D/E)XK endonuclease [bacterium]